ncbi:uncharacterized protein LOC117297658 [Asterias rubens]|uniref:uncharacterized protein LOC117297658 n=1 Tax=Asterias rubens TaxID=7604 RepID=UPI001455574B|nr:uncharacterized protein LOC117297658 [Asterias rubens]
MQDTTLFCLFVLLLVLPLPVSPESQFARGQFRDVIGSNAVTESMPRQQPVNPNRTPLERMDQASHDKPATPHQDSHCMNGGTGFLNTFCFCIDGFTGRYCETLINNSCGDVPHGQYVYRNCSICCCVDGVMDCRLHELEGCKKKQDEASFESIENIESNEVSLEIASHSSAPQGSKLSLILITYTTIWLQIGYFIDLSVR